MPDLPPAIDPPAAQAAPQHSLQAPPSPPSPPPPSSPALPHCGGLARGVALVVAATVAVYVLHRFVQMQYYVHCRADLVRIVFFQQSAMCVHMAELLNVVEIAYQQVIKQAAAQAVLALGHSGAGAPSSAAFVAQLVANVLAGAAAPVHR